MSTLSISEILPEEKRRLHELELKLVELERDNSNVQASDVYIGLNDMILRLEELDKLVTREPKVKRDDYRRRVLHLRNSHQHIKNSLDSIVKRKSHNHSRAELFLGADLEGGGFEIESNVAESASLSRSSNMVNNYIAIGQETISNLMSQKERLKGVQKTTLDMLNYLGISNSLMRSVERRDFVDKWIVYVGMILILLLLVYLLWWRK